jgi:ribosomal-protein-alanine acetyltransferase
MKRMTAMTITIEDASIQDLDRLFEIERQCFNEEAFTRKQIAQLLMDYSAINLVAKKGGKIIGFVIGVIYFDRNASLGHILTIDVFPADRRKGVGSKLLLAIEKMFKDKGVKTNNLEVREDNVAAINLYEKLGYQRIGTLRNYYGKANGIYLRKILA